MRLDKVDKLAVGAGVLQAYAFAAGDLTNGNAGAGLDYERRLYEGLSVFSSGEVGYGYGKTKGLNYSALAGLRWRW